MWLRGSSHITWPTVAWLHREAKARDEIARKQVGFEAEPVKAEEVCLIRAHRNRVPRGERSECLGLSKQNAPRHITDRLKSINRGRPKLQGKSVRSALNRRQVELNNKTSSPLGQGRGGLQSAPQ